MPRKALGLDINRDSITAVQVTSGLKGYQVTACAHVAFEENGGLEDGLKQILEGGDLKGDSCVLSIPAGDVSYRNLRMPFKDPRKIRKTLPYEIDSLLPFPIEDLVVDFAIIDRSGQTDILAGAIKKEIVSKYLAKLQPLGIDPEILDVRGLSLVAWLLRSGVVPDHGILLDICKKTSTMVLFIKKRIALIRTFAGNGAHKALSDADDQETKEIESYLESLCKMVRNTIHLFERQYPAVVYPEKIFFTGSETLGQNTGPLLSQFLDIPSEQINLVKDSRIRMNGELAQTWNAPLMDNALSLALRESKRSQGFNFRRGEFEVKGKYLGLRKELRRATIFIIIILAVLATHLSVDYYFMKKKYKALDQEIRKVFIQTFPDVKRIVDPLAQMKIQASKVKGSAARYPGIDGRRNVLALLKDIAGRIPKPLDVRITRMIIDPGMVRMSGRTNTFNAVENIKNSLEESPLLDQVTISSANLDRKGKKVQFEIKIKRVLQGPRS